MIPNELEIIERLNEIETRMHELANEAPILANALDNAIARGNKAQAMFCQMTMASRLNESNELLEEVNDIQRSLGIL